MKKYIFSIFLLLSFAAGAQVKKYQLFDADTKEPLAGATIICNQQSNTSSADGSFIIPNNAVTIEISYIGYETKTLIVAQLQHGISLQKINNNLQQVVISANRDAAKRTLAPVAIATINAQTINDTKATTVDQLINKVSGAYMVNLGNEQHSMGIRQPLGTRAVFMYLEDGIPVRTSGVFNHNALMEMNMAAVKSIEVIKGPSSSLYGGEAIGGAVNFITQSGTALPTAKLSLQGNDIGYYRSDLQTGFSNGKLKAAISGYYATRKNGFLPYSNFNKAIVTARADYSFSSKNNLENSFTYMNYYSDMNGGVDSLQYARKSFTSAYTFTWRKMQVSRIRSTFTHQWNDNSKTTVSGVLRSNTLDMNASFRIRDDYRKQGNSWVGKKDKAHGELSVNTFKSYVLIAQHRQKFNWLQAALIAGGTVDYSPNTQIANYIQVKKDSISNQYIGFTNRPDSLLTHYINKNII